VLGGVGWEKQKQTSSYGFKLIGAYNYPFARFDLWRVPYGVQTPVPGERRENIPIEKWFLFVLNGTF
jgi:hypothetical protein